MDQMCQEFLNICQDVNKRAQKYTITENDRKIINP